MTYKITIQNADVPWWRRLLRRHWSKTFIKSPTSALVGDPRVIENTLRDQDLDCPLRWSEAIPGVDDGSSMWIEAVIIEEGDIYL